MKRSFLAAVFLLAALPLRAQVPDARLLPAGSLRWAFTPSWRSWDRALDATGSERLLSSFVSSDSAGANLFPTLAQAETAVQGIVGPGYRLTLGAMKTTLDGDIRRFPLEFSVGLGSRVTVTGTFPLIVTRMNSALSLDSATGNVGWNQRLTQAGNPTGASTISVVLQQLFNSATQLSQRIAAGTATCAQPQNVLTQAQSLLNNLTALTGVGVNATPQAAPTAGSPAGLAITQAITLGSQNLVSCGVSGITGTLPLPTKRLSVADVQTILTEPGLGYEGSAFQYTKLTGMGDAELGVRLGPVQTAHTRVVLFGGARLPTGTRDSPTNLIDIPPADRQLDLTGGFEAALEPGSIVSLSIAAWYTRQFPDELDSRPPTPGVIINTQPVERFRRDLGDEVSLSAFPGLRLNDAFRVYAGGTYYRKGEDRYNGSPLASTTAIQATTFGAGIQYRSVGAAKKLPVEAGLTYSAVYTGSGGFVPKATTLTMYLRFYYWLWGGERGTGNGER